MATKLEVHISFCWLLCFVAVIVLAALKLAGLISWSWLIIAAPAWVPLAVIVAVILAALIVAGLCLVLMILFVGLIRLMEGRNASRRL